MSQEKIEVFIEIGPNLKDVIQASIKEMDLYNEPDSATSFMSLILIRLKEFAIDCIKTKKEKEIIINLPEDLEKKKE